MSGSDRPRHIVEPAQMREVLGHFVDAMSRGSGRPGPLLHRARSKSTA